MVIVEVDEFSHKTYTLDCEWSKLLQHCYSAIQTDGIEKIVFIRFNPDGYKGAKVENKSLEKRFGLLKDLIDQRIEKSESVLEIYHLFYEGYDEEIEKAESEEIQIWMDYLSSKDEK